MGLLRVRAHTHNPSNFKTFNKPRSYARSHSKSIVVKGIVSRKFVMLLLVPLES
jgi:hypothetical protein